MEVIDDRDEAERWTRFWLYDIVVDDLKLVWVENA